MKLKKEIAIKESDVLASCVSVNDLGNNVLYRLCKENFTHDAADKIIAKTNIIGRTYAVALDRGKDKNKTKAEKKKHITDDFFQKVVVPIFMKSKLDTILTDLSTLENANDDIDRILFAHFYLMSKLKKLNQEDKRSFCSKYLHFHLRNLFFIYDSRATQSINTIISGKAVKDKRKIKRQDDQYANFFRKSLFLQNIIKEQFKVELTPRQLDNYLLVSANEHLRNKKKIHLEEKVKKTIS